MYYLLIASKSLNIKSKFPKLFKELGEVKREVGINSKNELNCSSPMSFNHYTQKII